MTIKKRKRAYCNVCGAAGYNSRHNGHHYNDELIWFRQKHWCDDCFNEPFEDQHATDFLQLQSSAAMWDEEEGAPRDICAKKIRRMCKEITGDKKFSFGFQKDGK